MTKESDETNSTRLSNLKNESFKRSHYAYQLSLEHIGNRVKLAGWIEDMRPLGPIIFVTIRDVTGIAQAVLKRKNGSEDIFEKVQKMPRQSAIIIEGVVKKSQAKDLKVEVAADNLQILSKAYHPLPLDPTGRVGATLDVYLDHRALNLRDPSKASIFRMRHTVLQSVRKVLIEEGFIEVNTPKIIGQAVEGGANLFSFDYFGKTAYLAQSPQLYKEQLTLSLDRVFEVAAYYRAEKSHTRRHLNEFISVDVEAAFTDEEDVMKVCEKMVMRIIEDINSKHNRELELLKHTSGKLSYPFQRISYSEAVLKLKKNGFPIEMGEDLSDLALGILGKMYPSFFFIVDWPTNLKPFYIESKGDLSRSFDLQYGYLELASGGMRVSNGEVLKKRIIEAGLNPQDFSTHLKCFEWGMPPHSGWGLGLDRLMMIITGQKNIREVVLYPRDQLRLLP